MGKTLLTYQFLKACNDAGLIELSPDHSTISLQRVLNEPNHVLKNGRSVFCEIIATGLGNAEHIKIMIAQGADLMQADALGDTALTHAVKMARFDLFDVLFTHGQPFLNTAHERKLDKKSLLHLCVEKKFFDLAEKLLQWGANPHLQDHQYNTPLTRAIVLNEPQMVSLLIKYGADVKKYEAQMGISTIEMIRSSTFFLKNSQTETRLVDMLLNAGADPDMVVACDGKDPLICYYTLQKNMPVLELLLKAGADINAHNIFQETPMITAVYNSDLNIIDLLLQYGASINDVSRNGVSPLGAALYKKHNPKFLQSILDLGADVNICCDQRYKKNYALHIAVEENNKEYVDMLLRSGADPLVKNAEKETPYLLASKKYGQNSPITARLKLATQAAQLKQKKQNGVSPR